MHSRLALAALALAGCSAAGGDKAGSYDATYPGGPDGLGTPDSDTARASTASDAPPIWLTVDGDLVITGGVPDPLASELRYTGLDAGRVETCATVGAPTAFTPVDPPPDDLLSWWDITGPVDPGCQVPTTLRLGIGAYDAILDPAVAIADVTGTPYGLYTAAPDGSLWIFGVAGTSENFDGALPPVDTPPLPDGAWRLESLVLLPL
jgi:hypothetical protein